MTSEYGLGCMLLSERASSLADKKSPSLNIGKLSCRSSGEFIIKYSFLVVALSNKRAEFVNLLVAFLCSDTPDQPPLSTLFLLQPPLSPPPPPPPSSSELSCHWSQPQDLPVKGLLMSGRPFVLIYWRDDCASSD